jgi:hypothetical protein
MKRGKPSLSLIVYGNLLIFQNILYTFDLFVRYNGLQRSCNGRLILRRTGVPLTEKYITSFSLPLSSMHDKGTLLPNYLRMRMTYCSYF